MVNVQVDPTWIQVLLIFAVSFAAVVLIWQNRERLAGISTPYIDVLIGKSIKWLVALVVVTTVVTALLSIFGVAAPIRVLSAENLAYLAGAYWLVSKAG